MVAIAHLADLAILLSELVSKLIGEAIIDSVWSLMKPHLPHHFLLVLARVYDLSRVGLDPGILGEKSS